MSSSNDRILTKRFRPDAVLPYSKEKWFNHKVFEFNDFSDFSRRLSKLSHEPSSMVVLGEVAEEYARALFIRRISNSRPDYPASLLDKGSRIIHFDIDDALVPDQCGWGEPEALASKIWNQICEKVPPFLTTSVFWQASSSAGIPEKAHLAKFHFWCLLDQPINATQRRFILKEAGADPQLASISQPNYTAAPIFEGVDDPLAGVQRFGHFLKNRGHASVNDISFPEADRKEPRQQKESGDGEAIPELTQQQPNETTELGWKVLDEACAQIRVATERNNTIYKKSFHIGSLVAEGDISWPDAESALLNAGKDSGHLRYEEAVANGLQAAMQASVTKERPAPRPSKPQSIEPFHPAPSGDRDASIKAHRTTIENWAEKVIPQALAKKGLTPRQEPRTALNSTPASNCCGEADPQDLGGGSNPNGISELNISDLPSAPKPPEASGRRVMLSGAQGVGKTRAVVGANGAPGILHKAHGLVSILFEPDHGMAAQAMQDYDRNAPNGANPSIHLRGRSTQNPNEPGSLMCHRAADAEKLAKNGTSIRQSLCPSCPFAGVCGYLKQEAQLKALAGSPDGFVIFAPHDYAFLPLPGLVKPDLVIFDERPRDLGTEAVELPFEQIENFLGQDPWSEVHGRSEDPGVDLDTSTHHWSSIRQVLCTLLKAGQRQQDRLLAELHDNEVDNSLVNRAIVGLKLMIARKTAKATQVLIKQQPIENAIRLGDGPGEGHSIQVEQTEIQNLRIILKVLEALLIEIDLTRKNTNGIWIGKAHDEQHSNTEKLSIFASTMKTLNFDDVPFLYLDGTGDLVMAETLFGPLDIHHYPVEVSPPSRGDTIIQVTGPTFFTAGLTGFHGGMGGPVLFERDWKSSYSTQRREIKAVIAQNPGALVVANKDVIAKFKPEDLGASATHFGKIRGYNKWEMIDTVIVIGRDEPPPAAVERIARAYAAKDESVFNSLEAKKYPTVHRGVRVRNGRPSVAIPVSYHPDPWADRILRSIRDSEITQAIDRIRPIFKKHPIKVILMSPVVIDLTVDQVIAWKDFKNGGTRIERALQSTNVLPLSATECARRHPSIWSSKSAAQRDLADPNLADHRLVKSNYLENGPIERALRVIYKAKFQPGVRPCKCKALVIGTLDDARTKVEALVGPLEFFEILPDSDAK
ncbi:hypothetical protein [Sulfitobacter mediterraneus]|uniref:hypothetical protein n=1 Tax=Sulfitobacter mediterraneus TaxID=83219 RepID=UPI0021A35C96|nr:hypothetical protein [Sulfitobacter mediterraneus]UWR10910.1 hypothetical protein K3753_16920 [Sulfitobacter mediterraneus]